jgi:hypothetical protein
LAELVQGFSFTGNRWNDAHWSMEIDSISHCMYVVKPRSESSKDTHLELIKVDEERLFMVRVDPGLKGIMAVALPLNIEDEGEHFRKKAD